MNGLVVALILAAWADLRFAYWNLSKRLDAHIDEPYHGPNRRRIT